MTALAFLRENARWLAGGYAMTFASCAGQTFFISVFVGQVREELGLSLGAFGGIYMVATLASAATMLWLGKTADLVPLGRLAALSLAGLAMVALAFALSRSPYTVVLAIYGLRLFGQGMMFHIAMTGMGRWFVASRGRAVSIAALGLPTGEALLPIAAVALMQAVGWRASWMIAAAVIALVLLPLCVLLFARPREPRSADIGARPPPQGRHWTRPEVMRDPALYLLLMGLMASPFVGTGIYFHQSHLIAVKGWTQAEFASGFPVSAVVSVTTSLAIGWAIDRWSAVRLLPLATLPLAVGLAILSFFRAPWAIYPFFACNGMTMGLSIAMMGALWAEIYGTRHLGSIRAAVSGAFVASTAAAPGVMGLLIDRGVAIEHQLFGLDLYVIATLVAFWVLAPMLARRRQAEIAALA